MSDECDDLTRVDGELHVLQDPNGRERLVLEPDVAELDPPAESVETTTAGHRHYRYKPSIFFDQIAFPPERNDSVIAQGFHP
jgi:hypothetical protein